MTVYDCFKQQADKNSKSVAIYSGNKTISYYELDFLTDEYCAKLQSLGICKGDVVAVHLNRSYELMVFQLAVIKAGGVFLPVDKRYPSDRIEYMCNDCSVALFITDEKISNINTKVITIADFKAIKTAQAPKAVSNNGVCYIIYTSGSTGKPKGCMLNNYGLVNFCKNNNTLKTLQKNEHNTFACVNSVSFDYFIAESLLVLLNGYTTVILNDEESVSQEAFLTAVKKFNINVVMTTPTRLKLFYSDKCDCTPLEQLNCVCTSGEPLSAELLETIYKKSPNAQVYNPLGPSECTVWDVGGELDRESGIDIHIGKPIANTQIYILNKYMKPVPIGVTGELCIAGDSVGAGYLNRPELTAEKFVDNPFGEGKLYKTGDLAYWRDDGNIAYVGRNDFQVKIRGLRIELGEIESAVSNIEGINSCVVVARKNSNGRQLICAFYTGREIPAKEIRKTIGKKLPKYMLPHIFTHIDKMPMTPSGKINRRALPEIDLENITSDIQYVAPRNEREKTLCELVKKLLGVKNVGIKDSFIDLGGDSLKAIEYIAKAHDKGIEIALQNIFDYPTVEELSDYLNSDSSQEIKYNKSEFEKYEPYLQRNIISNETPKRKRLGKVLLTGATGFLGIHILRELLENENADVYCLVRGENKSAAETRLKEKLNYYFDGKYVDLIGKRINVLNGDITTDGLGIGCDTAVDTVIHTAATVKHYGTYDYFYKINVKGTENVIAYAKRVGAELIHISTLSVSGDSLAEPLKNADEKVYFDETCLYVGQSLNNVYVRSKFEAERAVFEAMAGGLDAKIIRVGNLTNRNSDMKFQANYYENAFMKRFKAFADAGIFPDYLLRHKVEFSPIDETAKAVVKAAQYAKNECVFHISSNREIEFSDLLSILKQLGTEIKVVDGKQFDEELNKFSGSEKTERIFETFQTDMDKSGSLSYDSDIKIVKDFTVDFLKKIGFEWPDIGYDYISRYVRYLKNLDFPEAESE